MDAIAKKAKEQGVWVEPTDPVVAKDILKSVDLSGVIPLLNYYFIATYVFGEFIEVF